jgi:hypothetical protein
MAGRSSVKGKSELVLVDRGLAQGLQKRAMTLHEKVSCKPVIQRIYIYIYIYIYILPCPLFWPTVFGVDLVEN